MSHLPPLPPPPPDILAPYEVKRLEFPDLKLRCPRCDATFNHQRPLCVHLRMHPNPRQCPYCEHLAKTEQNLVKHVRRHTGERPYACPMPDCQWAFKQKGDLMQHMRRGTHGFRSNARRRSKKTFKNEENNSSQLVTASQSDLMRVTMPFPSELPLPPLPTLALPNLDGDIPPMSFSFFKTEPTDGPSPQGRGMPAISGPLSGVALPPALAAMVAAVPHPGMEVDDNSGGQPSRKRKIQWKKPDAKRGRNNEGQSFSKKDSQRQVKAERTSADAYLPPPPPMMGGSSVAAQPFEVVTTKDNLIILDGVGSNLEKTKIVTIDDTVFLCPGPSCRNSFTTSIRLQEHIDEHHPEGEFPCGFKPCGKIFKKRSTLLRHLKQVHDGDEHDMLRPTTYQTLCKVAVLPTTMMGSIRCKLNRVINVTFKHDAPVSPEFNEEDRPKSVSRSFVVTKAKAKAPKRKRKSGSSKKKKKQHKKKRGDDGSSPESSDEYTTSDYDKSVSTFKTEDTGQAKMMMPPLPLLNATAVRNPFRSTGDLPFQLFPTPSTGDTPPDCTGLFPGLALGPPPPIQPDPSKLYMHNPPMNLPPQQQYMPPPPPNLPPPPPTGAASARYKHSIVHPSPGGGYDTPASDEPSCQWCHITAKQNGDELFLCGGCQLAFYCSKEHQKMDYRSHKAMCKAIAQGRQSGNP